MIKYAIQVMWQPDDWMYITEGRFDDLQVKVFNSSEAAEEIAEHFRLTGKEENVKVVVYKEVNNAS